jgi:hypothetical protein
MRFVLVAALLLMAVGCGDRTSHASELGNKDISLDEIAHAHQNGRLRFEVRGLTTEATTASYGGTTFVHKATVVALGDSVLTKRPYWLLYSVKRLSGGDPGHTRKKEDFTLVFVRDGIGELSESGGYRTSAEKWEPEQVELAPLALVPIVSISGAPIRQ